VSLTPGECAILSSDEFRFEEGPFEPAQLTAWADAIEQKYPDYRNMTDRAPALIAGPLTVLGSRNLFVCLDGEDLVGLLRYVKYAPDDPGGQRIEIIQFAVLPAGNRFNTDWIVARHGAWTCADFCGLRNSPAGSHTADARGIQADNESSRAHGLQVE
jgi:hypothetical protein